MDIAAIVTDTTCQGFLPVVESRRQQLGQYKTRELGRHEERRG
jgi:hypothetical protein